MPSATAVRRASAMRGASAMRRAAAVRRALAPIVAAFALAGAVAPELSALQSRPDPRLENRMLRQASGQEARGDLDEAEATLRELLRLQPGSSAAVFSLDRVLRAGGRSSELLPVLDGFLQRSPSASPVWALKLEVLAETGAGSELDGAVRAWIDAEPASSDPYLQGARALHDAFGPARAAELLEDGLDAHGELPQLLIELGDMHVAAGSVEDGAAAWARALGRDRARRGAIFRRVEELGAETGEAAARMVAALGAEPTTVSRLEAGAELALRADLADEAVALMQAALERLEEREARGFLNGFARKAEDLGKDESALWAYARLRQITVDAGEARATDERLAEAALAAGDTTAALAALQRIRESHAQGSTGRRAAWTRELHVHVAAPDADGAIAALALYRDEFPESPDLDELSATLASRLLGRGMRAEAMEVLSGIDGPGAALERAFLLLEGGAFPEGIASLQASLPELEPTDATEMLELTLALSELTPVGGQLVATVAIAKHRGQPERAARAVEERIDAVLAADRPPILALGARAADQAGLADAAATFRRRIVADTRTRASSPRRRSAWPSRSRPRPADGTRRRAFSRR